MKEAKLFQAVWFLRRYDLSRQLFWSALMGRVEYNQDLTAPGQMKSRRFKFELMGDRQRRRKASGYSPHRTCWTR